MAREYVPIFFDWLETTQDLTAEEKGNLIDAVVSYASGQEYEHLLTGGCKIAFRFLKGQVDRNAAISDARSKAGSNKKDQTGSNANKRNQTGSNFPKEEEKEEEEENKNKEEEEDKREDAADAEAFRIQADHDRIMEAAENAGFPQSNTVRAKLLDAYAAHGLEKTLRAIEECATHSAASIAYLQAVLNGKPRGKGQPAKTVTAQQYSQRDYSGYEPTQDETINAITQFLQQTG